MSGKKENSNHCFLVSTWGSLCFTLIDGKHLAIKKNNIFMVHSGTKYLADISRRAHTLAIHFGHFWRYFEIKIWANLCILPQPCLKQGSWGLGLCVTIKNPTWRSINKNLIRFRLKSTTDFHHEDWISMLCWWKPGNGGFLSHGVPLSYQPFWLDFAIINHPAIISY